MYLPLVLPKTVALVELINISPVIQLMVHHILLKAVGQPQN